VLRALGAKELSFTEIVGAYTKRGTKNANDLLEVQKAWVTQPTRVVAA